MTGEELLALRERNGWTQKELADDLNVALGRRYNAETIRRFERGARNIPKGVETFLEQLSLSAQLDQAFGDDGPAAPPPPNRDSAPGGGDSAPAGLMEPQVAVGSGVYVRACEELWELIATGVGMVGAATNSPTLLNDGAVIAADKEALGKAWGKLAETNETFRKLLVGMTEGGAWLQVAMVTGTTVSKCWQGHAFYNQQARAQAMANGHVDTADADAVAA